MLCHSPAIQERQKNKVHSSQNGQPEVVSKTKNAPRARANTLSTSSTAIKSLRDLGLVKSKRDYSQCNHVQNDYLPTLDRQNICLGLDRTA
jgi:hypothetical protein